MSTFHKRFCLQIFLGLAFSIINIIIRESSYRYDMERYRYRYRLREVHSLMITLYVKQYVICAGADLGFFRGRGGWSRGAAFLE